MKPIHILLFVSILILQACGGFKKMEKKNRLTTTPAPIELPVNTKTTPYTIPVNYILNIPRSYVPSCARMIYSPRLISGSHEHSMTPIIITGKDFSRQENRRQYFHPTAPDYPEARHYLANKDSLQITVREAIPFQSWMSQARLTATISLEACNHQNKLYEMELAKQVTNLPRPPEPVKVKHSPKEIEHKEEGIARFHYPVNGFRIDPALQDNLAQLNNMLNILRKVRFDSLFHITRIIITGICSPEGSLAYNENLARKRAEFIRQYLINHAHINPYLIETRAIAEDWEGLRRLITESTEPGIERALPIIDSHNSDVWRKSMLQELPQYNYIKNNLFPQLRKVVYEIYYTQPEKTEETIPE